ncbi:MAG TPA: SCO family protein [Fibrobacteria bacterium]|nr:SCO family protein [Fibrobacteria bacterium]
MTSALLLAAAMAVLPDVSGGQFSGPGDTAGAAPQATIGAGIVERLGAKIDPSLAFLDESGHEVRVGQYLGQGKPILLNFAYFHCPMLCGLVQDGMAKSLKTLDWAPGREYLILTVGMDWRESTAEAAPVRKRVLPLIGKPGTDSGWHFLTGEYKAVRTLARSVGFNYNFVPGQNDFAHEAGLIFLSQDGSVSRYLYGIEFSPRDMRLALLDASEGKSLSLGEKIVMMCYKYDPKAQGYVLFARNFMKAGGLIVLFLLLLLLVPLWRKEKRRGQDDKSSPEKTA